jgi:hypothetical protein
MSLGLVGRWPTPGALLLEADPAGGTLSARFGLAQQPGLGSLAAEMRHGSLDGEGTSHIQQISLGFDAVVGPGAAETAAGAVAVIGHHADTALRSLAPVVVADLGRLYVGSPATPFLASADAVVVLTGAATEDLDRLDARLSGLRDLARWGRLGVVVAGKGSYPTSEIADQLGVPIWGQLPRDRWGGAALSGRMSSRGWQRTRLARAVNDMAVRLAEHLQTVGTETVMEGGRQ